MFFLLRDQMLCSENIEKNLLLTVFAANGIGKDTKKDKICNVLL